MFLIFPCYFHELFYALGPRLIFIFEDFVNYPSVFVVEIETR